ncbi:MAG: FmdB family transcriptional regulator [Planctomycetes bacterium]|nr:FmdB family transcriptional regulator [Planctomycetota bacterium]
MPTYVYEVLSESGEPGERFEIVQKMTDAPLTEHPETGQPVRRVFTAPWIAGRFAPMRTERNLNDDKKLERLGFTKYVKSDDGKYEKTVGKGPDLLSK